MTKGKNARVFRKLLMTAGVLTMAAFASQGANAATQGTLGATSTGTSLVSLTIAAQYQITGLTDLALGAWSGSGNMTANNDVCVYTNDSTGNYHTLVTDSSGTSAFKVKSGANAIPYTVNWNHVSGVVGNVAVTYGIALLVTGANTSSVTCGGLKDANYQVTFLSAALAAASAGSYSTTLTMVIEP